MVGKAEAVVICVDNSKWMNRRPDMWQDQLEAIEAYCDAKLKQNPNNVIGIALMGVAHLGIYLETTSNLDEIVSRIHDIDKGGELEVSSGMYFAELCIRACHSSLQTRIILFVGGRPADLFAEISESFGESYKRDKIGIDVVNFCVEAKIEHPFQFECTKDCIDLLVACANYENNSHALHVPPGTSICEALSRTPTIFPTVSMEEEIANLKINNDEEASGVHVSKKVDSEFKRDSSLQEDTLGWI